MNQRICHLTVPGLPIAQPRARHGQGRTYAAPKSHKIWGYRASIFKAWHDLDPVYRRPFEGAVLVSIKFWFPRPKADKEQRATVKTTKPDLDNLAKGVLDTLQNVAYGDDACVVELMLGKWMIRSGTEPRTEICVRGFTDV